MDYFAQGNFHRNLWKKCFLHKLTYKVMIAQEFFEKKFSTKILKEIKHDDLELVTKGCEVRVLTPFSFLMV